MISAEAYWFWNAAMCACALPLGGRMAGLASPGKGKVLWSAGVDGLLVLLSRRWEAFVPLALLALPGSVAVCYHAHGWQACVRCTVMTLLASMLAAGAVTACLNMGLGATASGTVSVGIALSACMLMKLLPSVLVNVRQVELRVEERHIILPAMLDSGNLLRDPVTGLPVLVIPAQAARTLYPGLRDPSSVKDLPLGFRLLNVRTAAGSSLLPVFRPDECRIYVNGSVCHAKLLAAVAGREYAGVQALVPLAALPAGALPA